jgi:hypothetical protein
MSEGKHQLNIYPEEGEIIIRHGQAPEVFKAKPIVIQGDIFAPGNWHEKNHHLETDECLVIVDRKARTIKYNSGPFEEFRASVTGSLELNPMINEIGINTGQKFRPKELAKHLKKYKYFFVDKAAFTDLIKQLNNLNAKVNAVIEQTDDKRGNIRNLLDKQVESNLPSSFQLDLPLYSGCSKTRFFVEFYIDTSDREVYINLESSELYFLIDDVAESLLHEQIKRFSDSVTIIGK